MQVVPESRAIAADIERDLRVTEFLNGQPLSLGPTSRKAATNRLIDQVFIRREIRLGGTYCHVCSPPAFTGSFDPPLLTGKRFGTWVAPVAVAAEL